MVAVTAEAAIPEVVPGLQEVETESITVVEKGPAEEDNVNFLTRHIYSDPRLTGGDY